MKTNHETLKEYLLWLAEVNKKDFDSDPDMVACDLSVEDAILFELKNIEDFGKYHNLNIKEQWLKEINGSLEAQVTLLQVAPHMIFHCCALICAWRWIYDNVEDGAAVKFS